MKCLGTEQKAGMAGSQTRLPGLGAVSVQVSGVSCTWHPMPGSRGFSFPKEYSFISVDAIENCLTQHIGVGH